MNLSKNQIELIKDFFSKQPVLKAYLFGSYVRGDETENSDLDLLVELDYTQPIGLEFIQMQLDLQQLLSKKVDLVSARGLSKYIKPILDREKKLIIIKDSDLNDFVNNSMMFNASLRQLEIIGEASNRLSENILNKNTTIPWARIIGLRNLVIHEYFGIDDFTIWNVIKINLPSLKSEIALLIQEME